MAKSNEVSVVVAIAKDKGSQYAMKWAVDHLLSRGQQLTLLHVKITASSIPTPNGNQINLSDVKDDVAKVYKQHLDIQAKEVFVPFRCYCSRKDIKPNEVIIEDHDIAKAIIDYVASNSMETLVLGASSRNGFVRRFRTPEVTTNVAKGAPNYCTVYVIGKGKISSVRSATAPPPRSLPSNPELHSAPAINPRYEASSDYYKAQHHSPRYLHEEMEMRSPFTNLGLSYEASIGDSDISYVSSGRPSSSDRMSGSICDSNFMDGTSLFSSASSDYDNISFGSSSYSSGIRSMDMGSSHYSSSTSMESATTSFSSQNNSMSQQDLDVENEMRRLKLELKQTMNMYNAACKEALSAKQRGKEVHSSRKLQEQQIKLKEEAEKRHSSIIEMKGNNDERTMCVNSLGRDHCRYRRYTIEDIETATELFTSSRKIGEGGYGPVYVGYLDHTKVAIKVLRPDAAQGQSQFHQEVEVLSNIRHPNMVLLLGACPEYGCLVYEYMANGSLEDRLFRKNNTPVLPWQVRFRIAAEVATCLLFCHQTKPEPLVHRDLKPANILLDRNYVCKISDVGLARLIPPSVASSVTQYRMTQTAGTFCYIDPEYQQTGMLGTKSDVYSLGILLLQIITAKPPMGLAHRVETAIEDGSFHAVLDPAVTDWPMEHTLNFAKLALKCAEMRRKDRPDLGKVVLPALNILRDLVDENMPNFIIFGNGSTSTSTTGPSPTHSQVSYSSSNHSKASTLSGDDKYY